MQMYLEGLGLDLSTYMLAYKPSTRCVGTNLTRLAVQIIYIYQTHVYLEGQRCTYIRHMYTCFPGTHTYIRHKYTWRARGARITDTTSILTKVYMFGKQANLEGLEEVHAALVVGGARGKDGF